MKILHVDNNHPVLWNGLENAGNRRKNKRKRVKYLIADFDGLKV